MWANSRSRASRAHNSRRAVFTVSPTAAPSKSSLARSKAASSTSMRCSATTPAYPRQDHNPHRDHRTLPRSRLPPASQRTPCRNSTTSTLPCNQPNSQSAHNTKAQTETPPLRGTHRVPYQFMNSFRGNPTTPRDAPSLRGYRGDVFSYEPYACCTRSEQKPRGHPVESPHIRRTCRLWGCPLARMSGKPSPLELPQTHVQHRHHVRIIIMWLQCRRA